MQLGSNDLQGFVGSASTATQELKQRAVVTDVRLLGQLLALLIAQAIEEVLQLLLVHSYIQLIGQALLKRFDELKRLTDHMLHEPNDLVPAAPHLLKVRDFIQGILSQR